MKKPTHPIFCWPGSLLWLLPLVIVVAICTQLDLVGSLWWYFLVPTLVAFTFLDLFTKVWFGISILTTLFLYCSIGSSGVPISFAIWESTTWVNLREMRGFEMTEFEWFHWWPFKWLIACLCLNMSIVTIRKIPFNILTAGVWSIHTGVILLVLGCLVYFTQKIEGDVVISRNRVTINIPGEDEASMLVSPGNSIQIGPYKCSVSNINPNWELMSGDDKGINTYAVSISLESSDAMFTRQLIAGYPQYTEDVVRTDDPNQPMARAKNILGTALVDDSIVMKLEADSKSIFYVTQSAALYVRSLLPNGLPNSDWVERPIHNLPRFNDYVSEESEVWASELSSTKHPLSIALEQTPEDGDIEAEITVTDYLRYAFMDARIVPGGEQLNPVIWATIKQGEISQPVKLFAFDPSGNTTDSSLMSFAWIQSPAELENLRQSLSPRITATIDGKHLPIVVESTPEFVPIEGTEYSYKIQSIQNNLKIEDSLVSLAVVELKRGEEQWVRWVFEDASLNRDITQTADHLESNLVDENILLTYQPGSAPITLVAGHGIDGVQLLLQTGKENPTEQAVTLQEQFELVDGVSLVVNRFEPFTTIETRPALVPKSQRDPSVSNTMSMIRVVVDGSLQDSVAWLPYHHYPFSSPSETVNRFRYQPTIVQLDDGTIIELLFSRESAMLPTPVELSSFEIDTHIGGFSGRTSSILNWRSLIQFPEHSEDIIAVSVNEPKPHEGYWFFQSQWDPPSAESQGLNYTVLGVGNREGVFAMLFGTCVTVLGMLWAFYVKPTIKRKRQQAVFGGKA